MKLWVGAHSCNIFAHKPKTYLKNDEILSQLKFQWGDSNTSFITFTLLCDFTWAAFHHFLPVLLHMSNLIGMAVKVLSPLSVRGKLLCQHVFCLTDCLFASVEKWFLSGHLQFCYSLFHTFCKLHIYLWVIYCCSDKTKQVWAVRQSAGHLFYCFLFI